MGSLRVLIKGYKSLKLYYLCILFHQVDESTVVKGKTQGKTGKKMVGKLLFGNNWCYFWS